MQKEMPVHVASAPGVGGGWVIAQKVERAWGWGYTWWGVV